MIVSTPPFPPGGGTIPQLNELERAMNHLGTCSVRQSGSHRMAHEECDTAGTVVAAMARAVEARNAYTRGHSDRVTGYAISLATAAGLSTRIRDLLMIAGPLHDVGKIGIPDSILCKEGPLSSDECRIMQRHPVLGEDICQPLRSLRDVCPVIRHHHERYDGCGYPDGLAGIDIPVEARVLAIADAYDALTTDRPYSKSVTSDAALEVIAANAGPRWDPHLVAIFCELQPSLLPPDSGGLVLPESVSKWAVRANNVALDVYLCSLCGSVLARQPLGQPVPHPLLLCFNCSTINEAAASRHGYAFGAGLPDYRYYDGEEQ